MKLEHNDEYVVRVVLSRRYLLTLLHKLDEREGDDMQGLMKYVGGNTALYVRAETDETHYDDAPPGEMIPSTEQFIIENGGFGYAGAGEGHSSGS